MRKGLLYCLGVMLGLLRGGGVRVLGVDDEFEKAGIRYRVTKSDPAEVQVIAHPETTKYGERKEYSGEIHIPTKVKHRGKEYAVVSIGEDAFNDCEDLRMISVAADNPHYESQDGVLFNKGKTELVRLPGGHPNATYSVPSTVTSIRRCAFHGCSRLNSIKLPSSLANIGEYAFGRCEHLTNLNLPPSVTTIGKFAFSACSGLASIQLPSSLTSMGNAAFFSCAGLTSIQVPSSLTSIGYGPFAACENLKEILVDEGNPNYESEGGALFNKGRTELIQVPGGYPDTTYSIPPTVKGIGEMAFACCQGLTNILFPSSLTSIGNDAFSVCQGLKSIKLPSSVTSIGHEVFSLCENLTSIQLSANLTRIGEDIFMSCPKLKSIYILSETPPTELVKYSRFSKNTTIYVPKGTYEDYIVADEWSYYKSQIKTWFRVTFDFNGGSSVPEQIVEEDEHVARPPTPTKPGHAFVEWRKDGMKFDFDAELLTSDITLTAIWEPKPDAPAPVERAKPPLRITPTPASDFLRVEGMTGPTTVRIYNPLGQLVLTVDLAPGAPVDVRQLEAGVYLIEMQGQTARFVRR